MVFNVSETGKSLEASKFVSAESVIDLLKKRVASDDRKYLSYQLNTARIEYLAMPENMSSAKAATELILSPAWIIEGTMTIDLGARNPNETGTSLSEIFFAVDPVTGKVYGSGEGRFLSYPS